MPFFYRSIFCAMILISMFLEACSSDSDKAEIRPSLPFMEFTDKLKLEEINEIHLEEDDKQVIGTITSIQIAENGDIYLNDESVATVHVYSSAGKFLRRIGHFGEGPGEFRHNKFIRLSQDRLGVIDVGLKRINFFDLDSNSLETLLLQDSPEIVTIRGFFDFAPNSNRLYHEAVSPEAFAGKKCSQSFTFVVYNRTLSPITLAGEFDPFASYYCKQLSMVSFVRTDTQGNIYVLPEMVPRITKYSSRFQKVGMFNFHTHNWKNPFQPSNRNNVIDFRKTEHSRVLELEIGRKSGKIFIYHGRQEIESTNKKIKKRIKTYLTVLAADGQILLGAAEMPLSPVAIDKDENIFFIKSSAPNHFILSRCQLKRIN